MKTQKQVEQLYADAIERTHTLKKEAISSTPAAFEILNLAATASFSACQALAEVLNIEFDVNQFD